MKPLFLFITVFLLFSKAVNAQLPSSKFKDTYKERAQKETNTMISRYKLNSIQAAKVQQLNAAIYAEINTVLLTNKERYGRKKAVDQVRGKREQQLKQIFTKPQYATYRKDMDAIELKARQRADSLNRTRPRQRLRLKN